MLYSNVLSYFALNNVQDELSARSADIVTYRAPSLGLFRTQLVPLYQWGVAKEMSFPGMVMDIDQVKTVTISKDFDLDKYRAFNQSQGTRYSYMEGFVPEQFFSNGGILGQAVSAVSAIAYASGEGQKVFIITQDNKNTTLPLLTIDQIALDEIMAGLNSGMTVTVHESPIMVGSWQGSGYIVLDPEAGAGAYKITGGDNGSSYLDNHPSGAISIGLAAIGILAAFNPLSLAASLVYTIIAISVFHTIISYLNADLVLLGNGCPDAFSTLLFSLTIATFALPKLLKVKLFSIVMSMVSTTMKGTVNAASSACGQYEL